MKTKNIEQRISGIASNTPGAVQKVTETARKYDGRALKLFLGAAESTAVFRDPEAVKKVAEVADKYVGDVKKMKSAMKDIMREADILYGFGHLVAADVGVIYEVIVKYLKGN